MALPRAILHGQTAGGAVDVPVGGTLNPDGVTLAIDVNVVSGGGGGATATNITEVGGTNVTLGQAASAASFPVVIASDQSALTVVNQPALNADGGALTHVTNFPATQPVSGTVNVGNFPGTQAVSGTVAVSAIAGALPAGANALGSVSVSNFPGTQAVSGTVTANQGATPYVDNVTQEASVTLAAPTAVGTSTTGNVRAVQGATGMVPLVISPGAGDNQGATYFASYTALAGVAGVLVLLGGSATKIVRLRRFNFTCLGTAAFLDVTLVKYSTAATGGTTVTAATIGAMDSNNATATATLAAYSAAPTAGTSVGIIRAQKFLVVSATASTTTPYVIDILFAQAWDQAPTLRGVAQQVGLVLSAAPSGGTIDVSFEWTETAT